MGLADRIRYVAGDASDRPFDDRFFEIAWTQHVAMNVPDRAALYAGVHRVLVPGGRFAMYDAIANDAGQIENPVPWESDASGNYVASASGLSGDTE